MSDDILSGGRIDESTSGPNPPNRDDRGRDILLDQKEKQDQDAIGGAQFPPRPQPLPPIPEALEVAPPLPVIPSFDFSIAGSALEETREIARQTVVDVLKNVTINGQGPSFEGSAISFNIPQQPPASEAFVFQGIMVPQPMPQVQPIQPPVLPLEQPELAQEIQSFVVSRPPRRSDQQDVETPQNNQLTTTETIGERTTGNALEQPTIEIPKIDQTIKIAGDSSIAPPTVTLPKPAVGEELVSQEPVASEPIPESLVTPPPITLRSPQPQPEIRIQSFDITPTDEKQVTTPAVLPEISIPVGTDISTAPSPQELPVSASSTLPETVSSEPQEPPVSVPSPQEPPVSAPSTLPATVSSDQPEATTPETSRTRQQTSEASDSFVERIVSRIPENEPVTPIAIRSELREEGFQTTQRAWSNYIDPQAVKNAIEVREEARKESDIKIREALEATGGMDVEKVKDYYSGNNPFPPLIRFTVCWNGVARDFLFPAFGPYET